MLAVALLAGLLLPPSGPGSTPASAATPPRLTTIVAWAQRAATQHIPYVYAGGHGDTPGPSGAGGVDCSGFARWAYSQVGWDIGSGSGESMRTSGLFTQTSHPVPGDLVFFADPGGPAYHVGVFIGFAADGVGQMVDAPYTGVDVRVDRYTHNIMGYWHFKAATAADSGPLVAATPPPAVVTMNEGDFVLRPGSAEVYRIVGGAPVYVSTFAVFARIPAIKRPTGAQWAALPATPRNGTLVVDNSTRRVYEIAGGAPEFVSSFAAVGGPRASIQIDPAAVSHAGGGGAWSHLRQYPADGTYLKGYTKPDIYRVTAGRAVHVISWAAYGGPHPFVTVDVAVFTLAGHPAPFNHLAA